MFKTLEYVASGSWLYLAIAGGIVVVLALSWKTSLTSLLLSPFKWVWNKLFGKKVPTNLVTVAVNKNGVLTQVEADVAKAKSWFSWLTNSRFWKWLAGHSYDPGSHTWVWWVERLGGVAIILLFTHWHAYNLGKDTAPATSSYKAVVTALAMTKKRADTCQKGWDKCEVDYANYFKTDPPSPPLVPDAAPSLLPLGQPEEIPVKPTTEAQRKQLNALAKPPVKHKLKKFSGAEAP